VWVMGQLTRNLRDIGAKSESPTVAAATAALHRLLPDLEGLNLASEAAHLLPITASDVFFPIAYAFGYVTVVLLGATFLFERRDLR